MHEGPLLYLPCKAPGDLSSLIQTCTTHELLAGMVDLDVRAAASWTILKIHMVIYGFLGWEFVSQFPDEIRLIFWPTVRKFFKTGEFDTHPSTCCLLLARLLLIPTLAFRYSHTFVGGSDEKCTILLQGVHATLGVASANSQTILTLRTIAVANIRLRVKFVLWTLLFASMAAWSYSAASMRAAS